MNRGTKIVVYLILVAGACMFGYRFNQNYTQLMDAGEDQSDTDLVNVAVPDYQTVAPLKTEYHLGAWGAGLVITIVALGLMAAHDVAQFFGRKIARLIADEGEAYA